MKKHTNFYNEVDYETAPESWLVQAVWMAPAIILIGYIIVKVVV